METAMLVLLLVLAGLLVYLLFSPKSIIGPYLDNICQDKKNNWTGEDIGEQPFKVQEGTPFTASLEEPFDDPEVPNRPSKKKKAKPRKPKKRKYTKRSKK